MRVATFSSVSIQWLPYLLKSFREVHPHIEFELLPFVENAELEEAVLSGKADCCFASLPTMQPLDTWLLHRDQWRVIVSYGHPLAGRDPFPLEALSTEPFIFLQEGDDYEIQAVLDSLQVRPNIQYILRDDLSILAMVSNGLGISIMPELELEHCPLPPGGLSPAPVLLPQHRHRREGQKRPVPVHPLLHRPHPPLGRNPLQ